MPLSSEMQRQKDPLRPLTAAERVALEQVAHARSEQAKCVARAKTLRGGGRALSQ